ncbi:hypothetical protein DES53_10898 [Roseimicrobium gellanilyticum]|uniref:Tetratricopeptide repeat protein n=1 Tax=Roseimicrobium gellanilyticum TaxID=748857 RepID=A0A366HD59_9BACT|nr:hypothetical protein [Roseimicrobium gellanilyticum]RBP40391.1 hypothetical protein DES53_10898 [Roseimicrobium gellanilyticum]
MPDTLFLILCSLAWLYLSVLVHATVEVFVGKLVGLEFLKIRVGSGGFKWGVKIQGVPWHFHPVPFGVYAYLQSATPERLPRKISVTCLATLAANIAMVWALTHIWPLLEDPAAHAYEGPTSPILVYTLALRVIDILFQLLPTNVVVDGLYAPTLGKLLVECLTGAYPRSWGAIFYVWGLYPQMVSRYEPGAQFETSWLANASPEEWNLIQSAEADCREGQYASFMEKMEKLLANPNLKGGERARILDGMATMMLHERVKIDLQKALAWTREAQAAAPQAITIRGTHGALLVETGAYAEAIEMLTPLTTPDSDETDRIISSIFLAKACDRQGDAHQAALWLFRAGNPEHFKELRNRILSELSPEAQAQVV